MPLKLLSGADLSGQKIQNLADGTAASDAVTKAQLDAILRGLSWKNSVRAATTANIALSGLQTVDGVALAAQDRVLAKDQTTGSTNGIYAAGSGAWTRVTDFDDAIEVKSAVAVSVEAGTANGDTTWLLATDGAITVGTTSLSFTKLGGTGVSYTAGNGLNLSGSQFTVVAKSGGGLVVDGTGVGIDPAFSGLAKRFSGDVPAGSASAVITHNLGTKDVVVMIRENSSDEYVMPNFSATSVNTVTVFFATAPTAAQYRAVIVG